VNVLILILLSLIVLLEFSSFLSAAPLQPEKYASQSIIDALSISEGKTGFDRAIGLRDFTFPDDAGPHPQFQTEWWYYTGHLTDRDGREFGYQLTFFRRALSAKKVQNRSSWATNQIYFAHFTISDIGNRKFFPHELWSRGAAGLAGAQSNPFRVWVQNWSATSSGKRTRLLAISGNVALDLILNPTKPIILQGDNGLSQKSSEPGNASYYYSQTRLDTKGTITVSGEAFEVSGLSWHDREWSTSALSQKQAGWDWFSLQLNDGREIMLYQIRLKNGGIDRFSSGSVIEKDGTVENLSFEDFYIDVTDRWRSPDTGIVYPSGWRINIPKFNLDFRVTPLIQNQELRLTFVYWEGAVKIIADRLSGNGYVELTGYTND